ncbi:MAG: PIN domain-containing protein [Alphaproteobacteria bacterium]|nr:PIN domain-containing protein [Alphaproteobacteria bacterium]
MIAADTSSLSAHLSGELGQDVSLVEAEVRKGALYIPDVVLTEALSAPGLTPALQAALLKFRRVPLLDGYWERAGEARRLLRSKGLRARLGDALIAQACIDNGAELITRDSDFRHYAQHCALKLA